MLITSFQCEDCQKELQFDDILEKNRTNLSKNECNDYIISFLKKTYNNNFEYTVILFCKKCKDNIEHIFTEKENSYHFKCKKCELKGLNFSYFLSIEEDSMQNKDEENYENQNIIDKPISPPIKQDLNANSKPIDISHLYTNEPQELYQKKDENIKIIYSEKIKNPEMISRAQPAPNKSNSEYENRERIYRTPSLNNKSDENEKIYRTPNLSLNNKSGEKIMVTFIKNDHKYAFKFYSTDSISNQNNMIRKVINLGPNPTYYNNGNKVDINASFKENKIFNGYYIEIDD